MRRLLLATAILATLTNAAEAACGSPQFSWNPSDKNAGITLSNSNLTATPTSGSGDRAVRSNLQAPATGKYLFEMSVTTAVAGSQGWIGGILSNTGSLSSYLGSDNHGIGALSYQPSFGQTTHNGVVTQCNAWGLKPTNGMYVQFAVDFGAQKYWAMTNVPGGGAWCDASDNPSTGVGGTSFSYMSGTPYIGWSGNTNDAVTLNDGASAFQLSDSKTAGFTAICNAVAATANSSFMPLLGVGQ